MATEKIKYISLSYIFHCMCFHHLYFEDIFFFSGRRIYLQNISDENTYNEIYN